MQKKSFIKKMIRYMMILMGLLLLTLVVFFASSYYILKQEIFQSSENFLKVYGNDLTNRIDKMDVILKNLIYQNVNLALIRSENEADRLYASIHLRDYMDELELYDNSADAIIIADSTHNICLDSVQKNINYQQKQDLRDFSMEQATRKDKITASWEFIKRGNITYLYKMYQYDHRVIAVFLKTKTFLGSIPEGDYGERAFVLIDSSKMTKGFFGSDIVQKDMDAPIDTVGNNKVFQINHSLVKGQVDLVCFVSKGSILKQAQLGMVLALAVILSTLLFVLFYILYTRKELITPMNEMVKGMERIRQGEYNHRMEGDCDNKEFALLKSSFNHLMDEIIGLKIKFYEKRIELQETELKCIRLQIKPHFFLNAMSTISSLSNQGKSKQIQDYIEALSKNIRYMFKSGFHTVPVKEEIQHVQNYFEMQEMKYPNCIFYYIEMPKELEEWEIPQMIIHTIIENEYKYAISIDSTLSILIKISQVSHRDQEMLLIEIEDDGKGYPQYVLDYMNAVIEKPLEDGSRIGLWSIKRMMELMYERNDLVQLENIEPHGCLNKIYVPAKPVNELNRETIQNYI
ncbi:MAG TPA: histidine kinase [Mobilitalea sp.]|nr:histidine kinase [Mobilitalea sp.]